MCVGGEFKPRLFGGSAADGWSSSDGEGGDGEIALLCGEGVEFVCLFVVTFDVSEVCGGCVMSGREDGGVGVESFGSGNDGVVHGGVFDDVDGVSEHLVGETVCHGVQALLGLVLEESPEEEESGASELIGIGVAHRAARLRGSGAGWKSVIFIEIVFGGLRDLFGVCDGTMRHVTRHLIL